MDKLISSHQPDPGYSDINMAHQNNHWQFQLRIAVFLLLTAFLVLYHGLKIIDALTVSTYLADIVYLQTGIRGLIVISLLLVMMRRRFGLVFMWISMATLIATQFWVHFARPELLGDSARHELSYLRGLILPTIISLIAIRRTATTDNNHPEA